MVDNFALAVSHGLILLAFWRLLQRPDLEDDDAPPRPPSRSRFAASAPPEQPDA
jgi:hypothetical protein